MENNNNEYREDAITASLKNVREPKLSNSLIKLREVFMEVCEEASRGSNDLAAVNDEVADKFGKLYIQMQSCIVKIMANNITSEVDYSMPFDYRKMI